LVTEVPPSSRESDRFKIIIKHSVNFGCTSYDRFKIYVYIIYIYCSPGRREEEEDDVIAEEEMEDDDEDDWDFLISLDSINNKAQANSELLLPHIRKSLLDMCYVSK